MGSRSVRSVFDLVSVAFCVSLSECGTPDTGMQERASSHLPVLQPVEPKEPSNTNPQVNHRESKEMQHGAASLFEEARPKEVCGVVI